MCETKRAGGTPCPGCPGAGSSELSETELAGVTGGAVGALGSQDSSSGLQGGAQVVSAASANLYQIAQKVVLNLKA